MILERLGPIICLFFAMGMYALLLLSIITRKVTTMSASTDALTNALAELQASIASLETRLAAPAPVVPSVDEDAINRAVATVAAVKAQVDGLAAPKPAV